MNEEPLVVKRLPVRLRADAALTITRLFWAGPERARKIIDRVATLDDEQVSRLLETTRKDFAHLHAGLEGIFLAHYEQVSGRVKMPEHVSPERKLLIGAYFTLEYAFASAALFNPSMTPAINQEGLEPGALRFVMSLRTVGEGHISSIVFRRGVIDRDGNITMDPPGPFHEPVRRAEYHQFSKARFRVKLAGMGVREEVMKTVLARLGDQFTAADLLEVINGPQAVVDGLLRDEPLAPGFEWLAGCDYDIETAPDGNITDVVLFPVSEAESQGMEDMRIVRFTDDDGSVRYYGTYNAFNGRQLLPQIVEMPGLNIAHVRTLHGRCARNKGLALFPRKVNGQYMMSGRIDGENLYILRSDNVLVWDEQVKIQEPEFPWEFVQIGNCGSPLETEAGWLLLTHGVGPMRRYCIGAMLMDLDDPTKVIGRLERPLLVPSDDERKGYVPNVVYSCGGLIHNGLLVIPYGISDAATGFATVALNELLARLC
ncbi:MAG: glycoside hydrolase family 130 protein [Sedimentisphaerales bacterium]|nr:glycoside hydrolase family 130 protein [Sedimentisphaerales bacterium]